MEWAAPENIPSFWSGVIGLGNLLKVHQKRTTVVRRCIFFEPAPDAEPSGSILVRRWILVRVYRLAGDAVGVGGRNPAPGVGCRFAGACLPRRVEITRAETAAAGVSVRSASHGQWRRFQSAAVAVARSAASDRRCPNRVVASKSSDCQRIPRITTYRRRLSGLLGLSLKRRDLTSPPIYHLRRRYRRRVAEAHNAQWEKKRKQRKRRRRKQKRVESRKKSRQRPSVHRSALVYFQGGRLVCSPILGRRHCRRRRRRRLWRRLSQSPPSRCRCVRVMKFPMYGRVGFSTSAPRSRVALQCRLV